MGNNICADSQYIKNMAEHILNDTNFMVIDYKIGSNITRLAIDCITDKSNMMCGSGIKLLENMLVYMVYINSVTVLINSDGTKIPGPFFYSGLNPLNFQEYNPKIDKSELIFMANTILADKNYFLTLDSANKITHDTSDTIDLLEISKQKKKLLITYTSTKSIFDTDKPNTLFPFKAGILITYYVNGDPANVQVKGDVIASAQPGFEPTYAIIKLISSYQEQKQCHMICATSQEQQNCPICSTSQEQQNCPICSTSQKECPPQEQQNCPICSPQQKECPPQTICPQQPPPKECPLPQVCPPPPTCPAQKECPKCPECPTDVCPASTICLSKILSYGLSFFVLLIIIILIIMLVMKK